MAFQQVIIPKGLINPNETTIVEIPENLKNAATVVARTRTQPGPNTKPEQQKPEPRVVKKTSYTRRTTPNKKPGNFDDEDYQNFCADNRQMKTSTAYPNRCAPDLYSQERQQQSAAQDCSYRGGYQY